MKAYLLNTIIGAYSDRYEDTIVVSLDFETIKNLEKDLKKKLSLIKKYKVFFNDKENFCVKKAYFNKFCSDYNFSEKEKELFYSYIEDGYQKLSIYIKEVDLA